MVRPSDWLQNNLCALRHWIFTSPAVQTQSSKMDHAQSTKEMDTRSFRVKGLDVI